MKRIMTNEVLTRSIVKWLGIARSEAAVASEKSTPQRMLWKSTA